MNIRRGTLNEALLHPDFAPFCAEFRSRQVGLAQVCNVGPANTQDYVWERVIGEGGRLGDEVSLWMAANYLRKLTMSASTVSPPTGYSRKDLVAMSYNAGYTNIIRLVEQGEVGVGKTYNDFGPTARSYLYKVRREYSTRASEI